MTIIIHGEADEMEQLIQEDLAGLPIVTVTLQWKAETPTQKTNSAIILKTIKEAAERRGCVFEYTEDAERLSS